MINDQQLRNCPDCQFGCCLTRCLMSSDVLLQATSRGQLGSLMEPSGVGAHTGPQPCPVLHAALEHLAWDTQRQGPQQTNARNS